MLPLLAMSGAACAWLQPHTLLSNSLHRPQPGRSIGEELLERRRRMDLGRVIDAVNHDHPLLFEEKPDMSVYSKRVCLVGESGQVRLRGKEQYMKLFDGLRWARSSGFLGNGTSVEHRMVVCGDDLRLRWSAKLEIHDPFGRSDVVHADGISIYEVRGGLIRKHSLSNVVLSGTPDVKELAMQVLWLPSIGIGANEPILAPRSERLIGSGDLLTPLLFTCREISREHRA